MRVQFSSLTALVVAIAAIALLFVEIKMPPVAIDPASASRGSLGVSLEVLSHRNSLGEVSFFLNGAFVLLAGALAYSSRSRPRLAGPVSNRKR
ncbi:MAG: hypothetical protein ABSF94_08990 [Steroidobacteraceae bacterium]|jgi:hypothetical protein